MCGPILLIWPKFRCEYIGKMRKQKERDGGCGGADDVTFQIAICEINRQYLQLINRKLKCMCIL